MKKGKGVITVTIGLICFILTYVMFMQFRTIEETNITEIESMTTAELREKSVAWREKYEETYAKLEENRSILEEYKQRRESNVEASELLEKELLQAKMIAGETDVKGNGIVVTITDNENTEKITATDLLVLINELRLAGAEAISINDQRIINMSDVVDINIDDGAHFIFVNKEKRLVSPYVIKAIGDQKYLESALTTKTVGFIDQYSENATLERQNNIRIPKYSGEIKVKYVDIKEEK
ncbi:MAG: DUF881 domain-containing protein [Clostridia bacterium]|nr:DUF881 domain-containing protein [Clostridia bacterium]